MKDEEKINRLRPTYTMVPRKFVIAWLASFISMIILTAASIQWANFIDRRSNQRLCKVIVASNEAAIVFPPRDPIRKRIADAMFDLQKEYGCK